jgi:hypothetical protein
MQRIVSIIVNDSLIDSVNLTELLRRNLRRRHHEKSSLKTNNRGFQSCQNRTDSREWEGENAMSSNPLSERVFRPIFSSSAQARTESSPQLQKDGQSVFNTIVTASEKVLTIRNL